MTSIEKTIAEMGAELHIPFQQFKQKLENIKVLIFDWDGVFNSGIKGESVSSTFTEPDSMGINMLRFGYWLKNNQNMPKCGIITGMNNQSAFMFAKREHLDFVYYGYKQKHIAINNICELYKIKPKQIAFVFDDILDISAAKIVGLRFLVKRQASLFFKNYIVEQKCCDYYTANQGKNHAVREITELILYSANIFDETLNHRIAYGDIYKSYINQRNNIIPAFYENK